MSKITAVEPGHVLSVGTTLSIEGTSVYITVDDIKIPIGRIRKDYIRWFEQTSPIEILANVTQLVYIEDGVFGIRQMTDPWDEFKALSESNQRDIISKYVELMNED